MFSSFVYNEHNVFAQTDENASKLQATNNAVGQAFNAVLDAEKAGGNVTQLLLKLNTAGQLLAETQNAYNSGTTTNVTANTENVRQIAEQVNADAVTLRNVSLVESQNTYWLTLIFSVVGAVIFGISVLFAWRRFKRSLIKKLQYMKPEVVENTP
jgi:hypothetical protein